MPPVPICGRIRTAIFSLDDLQEGRPSMPLWTITVTSLTCVPIINVCILRSRLRRRQRRAEDGPVAQKAAAEAPAAAQVGVAVGEADELGIPERVAIAQVLEAGLSRRSGGGGGGAHVRGAEY